MEGSYFYFLAWMGWIVATFFLKKDTFRLCVSAAILIFISCSQTVISISSFTISVNALLLGGISFVGIAVYAVWKKIYTLLCALIIAMLYTSFSLIELYDPIWIVINRTWMLSGILVYTSILLHRDRLLRIWGLYVGALQGELFVAFVLKSFNFPYQLGSLQFFNMIAVSTMFFSLLYSVGKIMTYTGQFKQKQVKEGQG
ncbi:YphA family membrane protein [Bacillus sp. GB_SG_008]|uniref:YphA family membrane protein n=1 Tax=Bacillus sp. GB_SG_008 TaxID=3454627 RepID=UPI003F83617B